MITQSCSLVCQKPRLACCRERVARSVCRA
ncbi:UNVERIFIED_CONTAM: hypothetical protein GTU68_000036 [Idotea baltica]|nr:hypothetical protein [Idotea baltica]